MHVPRRKKLVLLGNLTMFPVPGMIWQTVHYLVGLDRLGYDVYYVEAHARAPHMFIDDPQEDGARRATAFIAAVLERFGLGGRWAYHALHADGACYGMSEGQLKELYRSADLLINFAGGTMPRPEHQETERLIYLETDPVAPQIELYNGVPEAIEFLNPHRAFFTFAENYGNPDCKLPVSPRFPYYHTRQPVVLDFWQPYSRIGEAFTTIASWRQEGREVWFDGELYHWSKHLEFAKVLDLPERTGACFELALNRHEEDMDVLVRKGWRVRESLTFAMDLDAYRRYIAESRGEFTVAKDQNVRLRSGWFSDRSASYLAAGKPVITQETGFSNVLPTGEGLFAFTTVEEAAEAVTRVNADYARHARAAGELAREYFSYDVVLPRLLQDAGL